jgi:hypothetical protein
MLTQTPGGNTMPKNVKVGWSLSPGPFRETHGPLYDFVANPFGRGAQHMEGYLQTGRDLGLALGFHINVMPWGDSATQSLQISLGEVRRRPVSPGGPVRSDSQCQQDTGADGG